MARDDERTPGSTGVGVKGHVLCQRTSGDLAIAQLRPSIPEHEIRHHQHDDMHLVVLLAGHYVSDAVGMPRICAEPALVFNPPGTEHRDRFRSRDGLFLTLAMPEARYARLCDGVRPSEHATRMPRPSLATALGLLRELRSWEDSASPLAIEAIFSELVADTVARAPDAGGSDSLQRAVERIEDDTRAPPSIRELANIVGHHPVYLARVFRKRFGVAPSDYLRKRRLHKAVSLIAQRRSLARAAAELGFVDECHLHRSFVAEFGMTPGAFRRLALGRAEVSRIQDARLRRR
ncbi:helix-turn-helix domain-containing protein [Lysobacter panacisoli]|uniref:HTH araC/xylS-type domain-containing protein n=1 Tax=Lysobacter panacisoli TaxID=1255263 RepID=A0ABP9L0K8_9GAMM|nr:AraC family transcriptional regulator [Lysobacter panacisoli]